MPRNSDDIASFKQSIDYLSGKIDELSGIKHEVSQILCLVNKLQSIITEKDEQIGVLEARLDDLEQYKKKENIIISGLKISKTQWNRHLFPEKGSTGENAPEEEKESLERQVIGYLNKKLDIDIVSNDISACHTLRNRMRDKSDNIIVRFVNKKSKIKVLQNVRKLKGSNVYINEHLTKKNGEIAKKAKLLRRHGKISNTWTRDCKVFVKTIGVPEVAKIHQIRNMTDFVDLRFTL